MNLNIDVNKLAIIIFVGIGAIAGIFFNQENITSLCFGGLVGYLSKEYTTSETIQIEQPCSSSCKKYDEIPKNDEDDIDEDERKYDGA